MGKFLAIISIIGLIPFNVFAFGPIVNGTYSGIQICTSTNSAWNSSGDLSITVGDNYMISESGTGSKKETNRKDFTVDSTGFFQVKASNGGGSGYETQNGIHYDVTLKIRDIEAPGEDTYFYSGGQLNLIGSSKISYPKGKKIVTDLVKCEAELR
jgi:hypothetical protein